MSCNLLESIHSCMVVLCSRISLHSTIIAISLEKFCGYQSICENFETFLPWRICNIVYCLLFVLKNFCSSTSLPSFPKNVRGYQLLQAFIVFTCKICQKLLRLWNNSWITCKFFNANDKQYTLYYMLISLVTRINVYKCLVVFTWIMYN